MLTPYRRILNVLQRTWLQKLLSITNIVIGIGLLGGGTFLFFKKGEQIPCQAFVISKFTDKGIDETYSAPKKNRCDSLAYWNYGKALCQKYQSDPNFKGIQFMFFPQPAFQVEDLCKSTLTYTEATTHTLEAKNSRFLPPFRTDELIRSFSPSKPTSLYREDIQRTGVNRSELLSPKLQKHWTRPLNVGIHTASKGSPSIDESGVYVGSDSSWFYAFDHQGQNLWKFFATGAHFGIHGTPVLDSERVYFGTYNGTLYALKKKDGAVAWAQRLGYRLGASPTLFQDHLYANIETKSPPEGFLAKIRASDGEIIWISPRMGGQSHSSPTINEKDRLIYAGANDGYFYAFDLDTGKKRWVHQTKGAIKTTASLIGDELFFSSWSKEVWALKANDGTLKWKTQLEGISRSSPTLVPDLNYLVLADESGFIYGLKLDDGKIQWKMKSGVSPLISSALVVRSGKSGVGEKWLAWIPCRPRTLCSLNAADGSIHSQHDLEEELSSVPVVWRGDLYLALEKSGGLVKFRPQTSDSD